MDKTERRRSLLATSVYLEGRSHAIIQHSRELIGRAQLLRDRLEQQLLEQHLRRNAARTMQPQR